MRIVYGTFAQGHGHFSKAAVLVPLLEARGHDVCVISSGCDQPPNGYRFRRHRHFPGMSYVFADGRTDFRRTFLKWLREAPDVLRSLWRLRSIVREFRPDLVISDFEPLTASPLLQPRCEVISISRQVALLDPQIPLPESQQFSRKLARSTFRLFSAGADRLFGYHYSPASYRCVPPVIRKELRSQTPIHGEHLFVYNHYDTGESGAPQRLVDWSKRNRIPVRAYGFPDVPRGRRESVLFQPPGRATMLDDMRTARTVFTSAGLTTPLEAFLLNKPVVIVPLPNQWEQQVNAFHLEQAGLATTSDVWDYDLTFELPRVSSDHPLMSWLQTPAEQMLDRVLHGTALDEQRRTRPQPKPAQQPAAA